MINPIVKTIELADGRTITLETGKLAKQADGAVMLRMGNTMLLATGPCFGLRNPDLPSRRPCLAPPLPRQFPR